MGYSTFTKCVESSGYPVLEYGIRESASDMVQLKAIKSVLGVHKFASNISVLGDMGWCPARIRRCLCVLRYWNRLILLDEKRLTKKIFQSDFENNSPWCKRVKTILSDIGKYCTEWLEDVKHKSKLRTLYMCHSSQLTAS